MGEFNFAEKTMKEGHDWNGLLLYYSSIQNRKKLKEFADEAKNAGMFNVAFGSYFQLNCHEECLNILLDSRRYPEAATFSRTYLPSKVEEVIEVWNKQIEEEDKNNRTTMKIISPINKDNKESLTLSENLYKEFYVGLNDEKNKLNAKKIEENNTMKKKEEEQKKEKSEKKDEKKVEEEEDEGEDDEEGGEEDDNEENK